MCAQAAVETICDGLNRQSGRLRALIGLLKGGKYLSSLLLWQPTVWCNQAVAVKDAHRFVRESLRTSSERTRADAATSLPL
eukprot:scaffold79610_cov21-Tisochrysis_lutea.AAC.5